ncbi:MAG: hypothetical protein AAFX06_29495 [Planctomycetota bacterium]
MSNQGSGPANFGDYDPRAWLERSGLLLLKHGQFPASIECLHRLVSIEPEYSMAWYGLSTAIYSASNAARDLGLLKQAVAVLKHCLRVDSANRHADRVLKAISTQTPLSDSDVKAIEASASFQLPVDLQFSKETFAESLSVIPTPGERMQFVMWMGTFEDESSRELLVAALSDSDDGVVRSTLKRLPSDADDRVRQALQHMFESGVYEQYQPYFSMATKRLDLPFPETSPWDQD